MGSVKVTVYGRVKPSIKVSQNQEYQIESADREDQITFVSTKIPSGKKTYRFRKLFSEDASQEQVFEIVAKPIIKSVLAGYNGTIFTYGQTGSGKTYTMTGDLEGWMNPGLIPRTVQEIFKKKQKDTPVTITYCEIYNEHVYDLIRVDRQDPDLPQVSLMEDSTGITHFRNLSVHMVDSAYEALQLLARGDANKMVAETNSNARSSRSHVIFSIGLEFPHPTDEKLCLKPVLYLVDLAGSLDGMKALIEEYKETKTLLYLYSHAQKIRASCGYGLRKINSKIQNLAPEKYYLDISVPLLHDCLKSEKLSKCKTPLNNPMETRYINLSLHYLEQVLIALRQPGRNHIPYRNSLMTALLRNSLGGNCVTAMIATFSLSTDDLEETLQTCRFAERIALIKNEVKLSDFADPHKEIILLKRENEKLKAQLRTLSAMQGSDELNEKDRGKCAEMVQNFIKYNDIFDLPLNDGKRMECCFQLMREEILKKDPKEQLLDKLEKGNNSVLDLPEKNSLSSIQEYQTNSKITKEDKIKVIDTNGGRKRTPMDLPKINLTYKRWKSTEEIQVNTEEKQNGTTKKIISKDLNVEDTKVLNVVNTKVLSVADTKVQNVVDTKDINVVESKVSDGSDSSIPARKVKESNSRPSIKNAEVKFQGHEPNTYILDGCFLKVHDSSSSIKGGDSNGGCRPTNSDNGKIIMGALVSGKSEFPGPIFRVSAHTPTVSMEKFENGKIRKFASVGIQVEDNLSEECSTADLSHFSSATSSSISSFDTEGFCGKPLPFTGDKEVDEEILKFYRARYQVLRRKF